MPILAISNPPKIDANSFKLIILSWFVSIYLKIISNFSSDKCLLINEVAITNYENYNDDDKFLSID